MTPIIEKLGIKNPKLFLNPSYATLVQRSIELGQGRLSKDGALVVKTGKHTGRSAGDKYVVKSDSTKESIWWENSINELSSDSYQELRKDVIAYLDQQKELFISHRSVGADKTHHIGIHLVSTHPSHTLFSQHLFREWEDANEERAYTILHAPTFEIDPKKYGAKTPTMVVTDFDKRETIIVGTLYAGEIKKSMFCVMNYELPESGVLPMHAGASQLTNNETSVFFGLSGTGKTTLSTDEGTLLIGDDEHGLSDEGIFNFENGCYAKTFKLSHETEPEIFRAANRFGAMIENVVMNDDNREIDYFDKSISENGRVSYPLDFIPERELSSRGEVPKNIFFLTADAFGVLPPVAKLNKEQAMFYFVLGYTAKLAGTEIGVKEPQATFSPCFGAPFMLRNPKVYADLLGQFLDRHDIDVWLVNTGWTGGPYGEGDRFPLKVTRQIIRTIQAGKAKNIATEPDPIFGLQIPVEIEGVERKVLHPQETWKDQSAYRPKAEELAKSFHAQMQKFNDFYEANREGAPTFQ